MARAFGTGNCFDFTVLASSMFEAMGIRCAVGTFTNEAHDESHAMVLVQCDGLSDHCYSILDLTGRGLSPGTWYVIEPQYPDLSHQSDSSTGKWGLQSVGTAK